MTARFLRRQWERPSYCSGHCAGRLRRCRWKKQRALWTDCCSLAGAVCDRACRGNELFRPPLITLRNHWNRENLIEPLIIRHTVKRLLIRPAERDGDEVERRWDHAENLAFRAEHRDAVRSVGCRV